jgi:hypothetical protein
MGHRELNHLGIHEILLTRPSRRDAMMPVPDEIQLPDLQELDRWQRDLLVIGLVNANPAVLGTAVAGVESPIEIAVAALASDDAVKGHDLQAPISLPLEMQILTKRVIRQEVAVVSC